MSVALVLVLADLHHHTADVGTTRQTNQREAHTRTWMEDNSAVVMSVDMSASFSWINWVLWLTEET